MRGEYEPLVGPGVKDSSQRKPMFRGRKTQQVQRHEGELGLAGLKNI